MRSCPLERCLFAVLLRWALLTSSSRSVEQRHIEGYSVPKPGLFCLEGDWYRDLRDSVTVEPILQLLRSVGVADYIHRDIGTRGEFEHYVSQWAMRRYSNYRVLYIATHGDIDTLAMGFGRRNEITLDELQDLWPASAPTGSSTSGPARCSMGRRIG